MPNCETRTDLTASARRFATESGKSNGQFYTPAEASRIFRGSSELYRA